MDKKEDEFKLNNNSFSKKITFLLGAGASIPYIDGLTTNTLTDAIFDIRNWKYILYSYLYVEEYKDKMINGLIYAKLRIIKTRVIMSASNQYKFIRNVCYRKKSKYNKYKNLIPKFNCNDKSINKVILKCKKYRCVDFIAEILDIFKKLVNELGRDKSDYNFEYIVYLWERFIDFIDYFFRGSRRDPADKTYIDLFKLSNYFSGSNFNYFFNLYKIKKLQKIISSLPDNFLDHLPILIRELLIYKILELWEKSKNNIDFSKEFSIFRKLLDIFESVNIYSLNYDPLLYEAFKKMNLIGNGKNQYSIGFREVKGSSINLWRDHKRFFPDIFLNSTNILSFTHGHIGFFLHSYGVYMEFNDNYREIFIERFKGLLENKLIWKWPTLKGSTFNTYFITGIYKFESFILNPFSSYIARFSKDLLESNIIVLVGTSLNDDHLNAFLVDLLVLGKYVVIVSKLSNEEEIKKYTEKFESFADIENGKGKSFMYSTEYILKEYRRNNSGECGYLRLGKRFYLYLEGTKKFFRCGFINPFLTF